MQEPFEIHPYRPEKIISQKEDISPKFFYQRLTWLGLQWVRPKGIICILMAFLLGRSVVAQELAPFGLAFLVAVVSRYRYLTLPVLIMVLIGEATFRLSGTLLLNGLVYLSLIIVFPLWWKSVGGSVFLGILTGVWSFGVKAGFYMVIASPVLFDYLLIALEAMIAGALVPPFVLVLKGINQGQKDFGNLQEEMASIITLAFSLLLGLNFSIQGYHISVILSKYLIMLAALRGAGWGAVFGGACGLVPGLASLNGLILAGLYSISGMLAGFLKVWGKIGLLIGFFCGNLLYGFYFSDEVVLVDFLKTSGIAAALFLLTPKKVLNNLVSRWLKEDTNNQFPLVTRMEERLNRFAGLFEQLAAYYNQSTIGFEQEKSSDKLLSKAINDVCKGCSLARFCWEKDGHKTYQYLVTWLEKLSTEKTKDPLKAMPSELEKGCLKSEELAAVLTQLMAIEQVNTYWKEQLIKDRQGIALQLAGAAKAMAAAKINTAKVQMKHRDLEETILLEMEGLGFHLYRLEVVGNRDSELEIRLELFPCHLRKKSACIEKISECLSDILDCPIAIKEHRCPAIGTDKNCSLTFLTISGWSPEIGLAQLPKENCTVSGDAVMVTPLGNNRWLFMLSDGMGSGEAARQESQTVVNLMENFLALDFSLEEAVRMVNALLMLNGEERFATLDLLILDLQEKKLEFVKIGAMPSLLIQSGSCHVLEHHSLPVGILDEINIEAMSLKLEPGTVLIMTTDGIWHGPPDGQREGWLPTFVQGIWQLDAEALAQKIMEHGLILHGGIPQDDLTTLVIKINKQ